MWRRTNAKSSTTMMRTIFRIWCRAHNLVLIFRHGIDTVVSRNSCCCLLLCCCACMALFRWVSSFISNGDFCSFALEGIHPVIDAHSHRMGQEWYQGRRDLQPMVSVGHREWPPGGQPPPAPSLEHRLPTPMGLYDPYNPWADPDHHLENLSQSARTMPAEIPRRGEQDLSGQYLREHQHDR